jgi:tRNA 2-selenouridine synthase
MSHSELLSAKEIIEILNHSSQNVAGIDVRSEGEFSQGALSRFTNIPILNNAQRHDVGLCFANHGQGAAIELGNNLVGPYKNERVKNWLEVLGRSDLKIITCWRGGLRSQIAARWLGDLGVKVVRVGGGYQALRAELLKVFDALPEIWVLSGPTGCGKTKLIQDLKRKVDLEGHAVHRGSAFGAFEFLSQPAQATFENNLALDILRKNDGRLIVEDESYFIGKVHLPQRLSEKIQGAPVINIKMNADLRTASLYEEYVRNPLSDGLSQDSLLNQYLVALTKIKRKLGGLAADQIAREIKSAFEKNERELHLVWIKSLLINYYDKMYEHSFKKYDRKIIFEGEWLECKQWIQNQSG